MVANRRFGQERAAIRFEPKLIAIVAAVGGIAAFAQPAVSVEPPMKEPRRQEDYWAQRKCSGPTFVQTADGRCRSPHVQCMAVWYDLLETPDVYFPTLRRPGLERDGRAFFVCLAVRDETSANRAGLCSDGFRGDAAQRVTSRRADPSGRLRSRFFYTCRSVSTVSCSKWHRVTGLRLYRPDGANNPTFIYTCVVKGPVKKQQ